VVSIDGEKVHVSLTGLVDGGGVGMSSMGSVRVGSSESGCVVGSGVVVGRAFGCNDGWAVAVDVGGALTGESDGAVGAGVEVLTGHLVDGTVGL
jgi:hypothetical protein